MQLLEMGLDVIQVSCRQLITDIVSPRKITSANAFLSLNGSIGKVAHSKIVLALEVVMVVVVMVVMVDSSSTSAMA